MDDVRNHPWMSAIDWDSLRNKDCQPPYVPDVRPCLVPSVAFGANPAFFQMKKANFDVSYELDEFMMVEKPLTHSKRKANPDLEKMKPELRQLEEQFTVYDFSKNNRVSYYPHNQPIVTTVSQSDSEPTAVLQSATNTLQAAATIVERSTAGSPAPDEDSTRTGITQRAQSRADSRVSS
jgi:serine/threonine kinase 32